MVVMPSTSRECRSEALKLLYPVLKADPDKWDNLPKEEKARREKLVELLLDRAAELRRNGR